MKMLCENFNTDACRFDHRIEIQLA
jgi:hypothetical protein